MEQYIQDKLDEFDDRFAIIVDEKIDGKVYLNRDYGDFYGQRDELKDFIKEMFTDYHNHIVEKIEGMKLEIPEYRNKRGHHTNSAHMKIRHNKALQMVQSLLQDTNPKE